jgi:hypothetical protein
LLGRALDKSMSSMSSTVREGVRAKLWHSSSDRSWNLDSGDWLIRSIVLGRAADGYLQGRVAAKGIDHRHRLLPRDHGDPAKVADAG